MIIEDILRISYYYLRFFYIIHFFSAPSPSESVFFVIVTVIAWVSYLRMQQAKPFGRSQYLSYKENTTVLMRVQVWPPPSSWAIRKETKEEGSGIVPLPFSLSDGQCSAWIKLKFHTTLFRIEVCCYRMGSASVLSALLSPALQMDYFLACTAAASMGRQAL